MGTLTLVRKSGHQLTPKQARALHRLGMASSGLALAGASGSLGGTAVAAVHNERKATRKVRSSKERGKAELAKAETHLEEVAKNSYMRRTPRDPGSELDVIAAAKLMLDATHQTSRLPWRRKQQLREQLQLAIARGKLNAPYTIGP